MVKFTRMTQHAVNFHRWIFVLAILFSAAVTNVGTQLQSKSCTNQQASKNRNAFSFRTFGNVSSLEDCVDLCCGDETCELAILSKGFHCFGVSCFEPKVCHRILDRLLMDDEREIGRSSRNTGRKDFIRHTSQIANPKCPQRFVPSFQVLLLGRRSPRDVYKLRAQPTDASQCSAQCCRSRDCSLSFIEDDECFGVTGSNVNGTNSEQGSRIGLQIAIIDRNKEVSRSLDDDDEDPDELGSDDADKDTPTTKPVVSTIKSKSKLRHFPDIPKREKTHKLAAGKIASSPAKETKQTFASGSHIAAKSEVTYSTVPLRRMGVTQKRKQIFSSGKDSFSHLISKARALNVNGADKQASEVSDMVRPSDSLARKETTIHGRTRGNETPKHEVHSSPTVVGNRQYQASDLWKFQGSKFDPKSRKVRVESFASHSAEKSFLEDDEVGSSKNFDSSSYEREGLSADGEMSGDDVVSGDFDSSGDGDLSRYGYLRGHRLPIRAVKDSSEGYNDVSGEGDGQNGSKDESGYDSSGEDKHFSGNDDDFSVDSFDTMTYNPMRHKVSAGEREEYETTRKTVDVNFSGSGDRDSDKGSGDNSEIQKKTSLNKNNKKRKMDLNEALDDLDEGTTRKSGNVVPLPQRGSATMKSKVIANSSHPNSQEDVKEIKGSKIIEHLNDLGSGDADSEKSSKEVTKLHQEANNSREEGEKKVNKKLRKLKHRDNTREKSDLMEEADALGSDEDGNEKISESVEHLLHETTNSAKKREKVDNKQVIPKQKDSLRRKSELVNDPDDLGSEDDDETKARKATHLLQETRTSKTAKKWQKAGKETMKLKEGSISKKSTIAEVPNSLTSADGDDESNRKVFIAHKQTSISEAESQSKTFLRKQVIVKSQKEGSKREEIEHAEDPDDLGSDNDEEEKSSKELSRLSYQTSTSKVIKNRKNHQALKKGGSVKEKMDFVEDLDELGSDDSDPLSANQDTSRKMATRLPPQTQVSRTGRKQQKFSRSSSTKEKIDFVQDLNHLGLRDDKSGISKLRKHDALTPTKVTKLSKTSNRSISSDKRKSIKYLKSSDAQTASNLNLAEDLDDLGADDDNVDETKPEQPALSLPLRTNDRTGQIHSAQRTSSGGHMGSPPRNKDTKQASTTFGLSVGDSNKSHIVSRQSGHSISGGLTHHGISHVLGPIQVKGKSDLTKASRVKNEKQKQQTMHIEEKEPGQAASLKQVKKPSPSIKTENILNSKSGEAIVQNKGTKGNSTNPHKAKLTITEPTKTKKVPTSSETLKAITKNRSDGAPLNNQATLTRTKTVMAPIASNDKLKVSVKAHIANKNHLNVTSKERAEKSTLRDENKSAIKANKPKESVFLKRKDTAKQRKTPSIDGHKNRSTFVSRKGSKESSKVSSKFEIIDDLMKFAHRKTSESGKKTSSGKTIPRKQGREKVSANDNGTVRGKQPMTLHPTKTKTIYPVHRKKVIISHLQSSGKLAAKKSQTTASPPVSRHFPLTTQFHASSKKNGSSSSTLASKAHFRTQEANPPERNQNTFNRAFLSLKQRSNEQVLDNKSELLAHFRNVNGSDGVEFSVKTSGSHHKEKHSKHDLSFDLDDIGDADFDIMMSNDIPHKHLPEKKKGKQSREKHTKSSDEKQRDPSPDSLKNKRKNSGGELRNKGDDNSEESKLDSETHNSHHKHKEITNDVITRKRHHHHKLPLKETGNNVDSNDRDETHLFKKVEKGRSHDEKKSHRHDRHDTSNSADEKDSERVHHHHKKHRHRATTTRKDDFSDDKDNGEDSKVKSDHKKRRKERDKAKNYNKLEEDEKVKHHKHRSHKAHKKKYDNNDWEGNIIPGKVKLVYEKDSDRKRHHKHNTRNEEEINHHKRKHVFEAKKSREDSENNKDDSHSHREHHTQSDDYNQRKKHAKDHEAVKKDDSEEKLKIKNDNEEEHAEKKKEVNYEAIKTGRHRFVQHEDDNEGETRQGDDYDSDREDGSSWTSKKDDKDDENEKSDDNDNNSDERGKSDDSEDANDNDADDDDKEERPSKETKKNMVVLGEDSDSDNDDDDDDAKHSRKVHEIRHGHRHVTEHSIDEQENEKDYLEHKYHEENHKSALHHRRRHKYHRHLKAKHRHHESDYENKEDDYNDENDDDDDTESRKSFIKHGKEKEDEIRRDHYDKKRNRKKQHYHDTSESSEENKDYGARKFHRSHHRHHHLRPVVDINRIKERPADGYEPDDEKNDVGNDEENDEEETFPRRHRTHEHGPAEEEDNDENFQREKEGSDDHFASPEHDRGRWKFKPEENHREFKGASHQLDNQDFSDNRFIGEENHKGYHHNRRPEYNLRPKFKPKKRKKEKWKNRYYYNDNEDQDYEDSGGLFDSSSWIPNENYDDDDFYGGEGNHERRHHRKKHGKYKNRKDRQSYEYWAYGNQYPYYYGYKYHRVRSRYQNNQRQPNPYYDWHNRYRNYNGWKPTPSHWYSKQTWDGTRSWRQHPKWRQRFDDYKPTGYQWHKFYDNNDVYRDRNQPRPTAYPREASTFLPPTSSIWQKQPDATRRGFIGDKGQSQNREPGKNYQDWSRYKPSASLNQASSTYGPQQRPLATFQPRPNPDAVKPVDQTQPLGIVSNYVPPASQQGQGRIDNQTKFRPTVRRQYAGTPPLEILSPTNDFLKIKNLMDTLNTSSSASNIQPPTSVTSNVQNNANIKNGLPKINVSSSGQDEDQKRLNGFFNEENSGKKSDILRPKNTSQGQPATNVLGNNTQTEQHTVPKTTSTPAPAKLAPQPTKAADKTSITHTIPIHTTTNNHTNTTSTPKQDAQTSSTTAAPTQKSTTEQSTVAPNIGDVSQSDDSSETGKKHRKHRAPVCIAGKTTDDVTLLRGKKAGNFTNIGDVGDFGMCIKRCCQQKNCDLAFKSSETCFLVSCFSKESCKTSPSLDDIFSPRMCFVRRHLLQSERGRGHDDDDDDEWNDKVSPSGIQEVCEAERALGIMWTKTGAGHYSRHPCPREAKGFVKRRCEADSRWLPPNFSDCVSNDYQALFEKSRKLAGGADPSPLIRELSLLTTQNIDNSLIFGGDLDRASDIMAAIVQHNGQTDSLDMTREDVENFVRASSNLLDMTNQQEWFNIQKNRPGSAGVLRLMEMFALQAARRLPREDMADAAITNNIIIKLDRKSPGEGGLTFPDFSNPRIDRWDARHDVIALPSSVFDQGEVSTASISFKSLPYLLPDTNVSSGLGPNSKVISIVMHPHPQGKITPPVTVVLTHIKRRRGNPKCVFWDYTLSPHRGGAWSSRGCWLAFNNHSHSICQCSHLSNFAVLMDLSSDESLQKEQKRERTMALMWIGIPVLIVGVIGGLYMSFSWNRKSGIPSTVTRPSTSLNEKTGLLGQRVVTSQVREEFPASPTRDLYRALSPGYSPTGDLEWQDEFDFDVESGDQRFKQMLLPKLQLLQNQLINEFCDAGKLEAKKNILNSKIEEKTEMEKHSPNQKETDTVVEQQKAQLKPTKTWNSVEREPSRKRIRQSRTSSSAKLRVRFADESPPSKNRTDEDKERFKRLQQMERRVFAQHLSRWTGNSHLNLSE